jgi:chemotaxis methyl-accepting protein methylase
MTLQEPIPEFDLKKIKDHVRVQTGFNLSYFKPSFLTRRINVRMKVLNITSGSEYAKLLKTEPDELHSLYDSLSINVTKFYRDKQVWNTFSANILPILLKSSQPNDTIRICSSGCATGEESYSLAIMFYEAFKNTDINLRIIATDINSVLLRTARKGEYTSDILENVDPVLIKKYFFKIGSDKFRVNKKIRDLISFHVGDIVTFPVSYLDVIFCRNLLIYYSKDTQGLILKKFSNELKENKFLVLGMDESMIGHKVSKSFLTLYPRERIYQKRSATDMLSSFISKPTYQKRSTTDMLSSFISERK